MRGDHEQARGRDRVRISEYLTVPELAQMVRRNRRTLHRWIATGEIGETDGLFVVQERFLIHGPTFREKQFKSPEKLRCQISDFSEASMVHDDRLREPHASGGVLRAATPGPLKESQLSVAKLCDPNGGRTKCQCPQSADSDSDHPDWSVGCQ
jgi:hypothetical protein